MYLYISPNVNCSLPRTLNYLGPSKLYLTTDSSQMKELRESSARERLSKSSVASLGENTVCGHSIKSFFCS